MDTNNAPLTQKGIYLANFNPSKGTEAGKIRPALVIQNNLLNQMHHASTLVMPLTSQLSDTNNVLRFRISKRQQLTQDSDVMLDQVRAIDNRRITSEVLALLTDEEWAALKQRFLHLI